MPQFSVVASAVVEAVVRAPDAKTALMRWRTFQRRNRARKIGRTVWLTVDGDMPVVIDEHGVRVQIVAGDWGPERKASVT